MHTSQATGRFRALAVFGLLLTLAAGCAGAGPSEPAAQGPLPAGLSQAAHQAAVNRLLEIGTPGKQSGPCRAGGDIECRDFQATCARALELTEADRATGVEEKWCVQESYARRIKPDGAWTAAVRPVELARRGTAWDASFGLCGCE